MINKLVLENLKHRPIRTLLSTIAIGIQVTMVLTLVGLSEGLLQDQANRTRGIGADVMVRAPGSSILSFSTAMPAGILTFVRKQPHVTLATGVLIQPAGGLNSVTGLNLDEFTRLSGGFRFVSGGPFKQPNDVIVDDFYAAQHKTHTGDSITILNRPWHVCGIVEAGMLARVIVRLDVLQDLTSTNDKLTSVYVKLDDANKIDAVVADLKTKLRDYPIYSIPEYTSLFSVKNVPMLKEFIGVIIGLGVLVGFLVVFLSMYTAVLERTREIGVLKALGASPGYILSILLRETTILALAGSVLGILLAYVTRWAIKSAVPGSLIQAIVPSWWPIATGIALFGALVGAIYPGIKAARQDAIEALSYD
ncbi:MAG: ABC transporter permease [Acidobacteriota bacterium]|nr:ABC transporter permease [Acidobacteriota bacterium]